MLVLNRPDLPQVARDHLSVLQVHGVVQTTAAHRSKTRKGNLLKYIRLSIALLASWLVAVGSASGATPSACVPYKIPIASTMEACGAGLIGMKFKTKTKECPSGVVTESRDFDVSGCSYPAPAPGTVNNTNKCLVTPDACAPAVNASNCQPDEHWTLQGSNIAHCVKNDPVCPWGTSLKHDFLGNPSCEQNTCSGGQVLQADGKSCACPANMVLNGGTCVPATPSCVEGIGKRTRSCPAGYTGTIRQEREISCPSGPYGAPVNGSWETVRASCMPEVAEPAPATCTPDSSNQYADCPSGTGTMSQTVTVSCPAGAGGAPKTTTSGWNTSACSGPVTTPPPETGGSCANGASDYPTCTPTTNNCTEKSTASTVACGGGFTGTRTVITTFLCPSGTSTDVVDNCGCANGADDYPTCTPPVPPPNPGKLECPAPIASCFHSGDQTISSVTYFEGPMCDGRTVETAYDEILEECPNPQ